MVDNFVLVLTHGLLALAAWRLVLRIDLDSDPDLAPAAEDDARPKREKPSPRA
jgi:hypothetical protein